MVLFIWMTETLQSQTVKCRVYSIESNLLDEFIKNEKDSLKKITLIDKQRKLSRITKSFIIDSIAVSFVYLLDGQLESFSINNWNKNVKYSVIHDQVQNSFIEKFELKLDTIRTSQDSLEFLIQSPGNATWKDLRIPIRMNLPLKVINHLSLSNLENLLLRNILFQEEINFAREIYYGYPKTAYSLNFIETIEITFANEMLLKKIINDPSTNNCKKLINEIKWN